VALFTHRDEIERAWAITDPLVQASEECDAPQGYAVGAAGPAAAFRNRESRAWLSLCHHEEGRCDKLGPARRASAGRRSPRWRVGLVKAGP
jgi:hypothetical protein